MGVDYSLQTIQHLENLFDSQEVLRPRRRLRYEPETELQYRIRGVFPPREGQVKFRIERFVGGGYAGQVYRVKALEVEPEGEPIIGLQVGQVYALKILVPPNGFARWFWMPGGNGRSEILEKAWVLQSTGLNESLWRIS